MAERYVYLRITVNGKACELSTKRVWHQEKWSGKLGFSFWLRTVKNCGHNSAVKYLTNLKKILLSCLRKAGYREIHLRRSN